MSVPVPARPVRRTSASQPHVPAAPLGLLGSLRRHRFLIAQLTRREVIGRYRGSHLGILWSLINPLLLLCIYTLVFKYIFHPQTPPGQYDEGPIDFSLRLFAALIIFNLFAECLGRAPSLMLINSNYVTKVVFPLELLPLTVVLGSLVHLFISFVPLCLAIFLTHGYHLHATVLAWPLLLIPVIGWALSITWIVSALGAFLRDLNEVMLAVTQVLIYASAVFYPIASVDIVKNNVHAVPGPLRLLIHLNPLAYFCEQSRRLAVSGIPLDWAAYGRVTLVSLLAMFIGYRLFMSVKQAFADVI